MESKKISLLLRLEKGQSMVEIALSAPFLMLVLVALLYFGKYFLMNQVLLYAAQEGSKVASRTPNLSDDNVRNAVRGFYSDGTVANTNSVIFSMLNAANLLHKDSAGQLRLPKHASVEILPWDSSTSYVPPGTLGVKINYPFNLWDSHFPKGFVSVSTTGHNDSRVPIYFWNLKLSQSAIASQEVYQE